MSLRPSVSWLLALVPIAAVLDRAAAPAPLVFLVAALAIVPLAALIVHFALTTIYRAWRGEFARHRRIARWTLPVWLYVSVTGVLVYWMLYHLGP